MTQRLLHIAAVFAFAGLLLAGGCSPEHYRKSADDEVYSILRRKAPAVPGMEEDLTIETCEEDPLRECPTLAEVRAEREEQVVPESARPAEEAAVVLSLDKALEIAATNSREYQSERERLYLTALSLTLSRYEFAPQFFGLISGDYDNTDMGDEEEVSGDTDFGVGWLFATGTRVSASLGSSISQFLTHDPRKAASSVFELTVTQPLLQGAGVAVTEPLTQAERDVIYSMRDFVRFRRRFFVDVLSDYYGVLRQRQILENERLNYESLARTLERYEWLARAGEIAEFEVDRIRQDELRAEDRLEAARQSYEARLDAFKVTLGLPTEARAILDPAELEKLTAEGDVQLEMELEKIVRVALERRLDLMTARERVEDAERKVEVARNDLLPGLDLSASLTTDTDGENSPADFQGDRTDLSAGFELDLPLDKKAERNAYRRRLIGLDSTTRDYERLRDEVVQDVRDSWRQYGRAGSSYQIQKRSVELAERRVESAAMRLDAGRAEAQDLLDARNDLVEAQNTLTRALVDYKVARLQLARDMEILNVARNGQLQESFDEYR
jgi:outer membrane protein TolC